MAVRVDDDTRLEAGRPSAESSVTFLPGYAVLVSPRVFDSSADASQEDSGEPPLVANSDVTPEASAAGGSVCVVAAKFSFDACRTGGVGGGGGLGRGGGPVRGGGGGACGNGCCFATEANSGGSCGSYSDFTSGEGGSYEHMYIGGGGGGRSIMR